MSLQEIESMVRHASGDLWQELPIWAQTPPIAHRALSALALALGDSVPQFIHVRAKPDSAAFSLWVFTETRADPGRERDRRVGAVGRYR